MAANWVSYTIADGQTAGPEIDLSVVSGGGRPSVELIAVHFPSTFDGAAVTIRGAIPGGSFIPIVDSAGTSLSLTPGGTDRIVLIGSGVVQNIPRIKLVAGSAQTGATEFSLLLSDDPE